MTKCEIIPVCQSFLTNYYYSAVSDTFLQYFLFLSKPVCSHLGLKAGAVHSWDVPPDLIKQNADVLQPGVRHRRAAAQHGHGGKEEDWRRTETKPSPWLRGGGQNRKKEPARQSPAQSPKKYVSVGSEEGTDAPRPLQPAAPCCVQRHAEFSPASRRRQMTCLNMTGNQERESKRGREKEGERGSCRQHYEKATHQ